MNKIRVGGFFSGIGSHISACDRLKDRADFEYVFQCEFDPKTALAHDTIHGPIPNLGDITTVHDIGGDLRVDILFWTPPCIRKGDRVLTSGGYIPIEDVREGDSVLAHDGQWHKVTWAGKTGHKKILGIKASCGLEVGATEDHRFYARKMTRVNGKRVFSTPEWTPASDLTLTHYLGFPIGDTQPIPEWGGITMEWSDGRKPLYRNEISEYIGTEEFWWSVGRYIADGCVCKSRGTVAIMVGKNKSEDIPRIFPMFKTYTSKEGSVFRVQCHRKEVGAFCEQFGMGAGNKHIPEKWMHLPKHLARALVDGYMAGDGCPGRHGMKCNTISIQLAHDLVRLIGYAYERPAHMAPVKVKEYTEIEGRIVHQHPYYEVYFHPEKRKQDMSFYEDGWIWTPIRRTRDLDKTDVYDLTVEDAHSFIVNGITVHNCQSISAAGKMAGNTKGSGTPSSLAYEVPRIIANTPEQERPKYLVMEEVPMMISDKFRKNFDLLLAELTASGYRHRYGILNAADCGVAQSRRRCFVISKLLGTPPDLPKPIPLDKCLRDYLEPEPVAPEYYLSEERLKGLVWSNQKEEEKGYGYRFEAVSEERERARTITSHAGSRKTDNYLKVRENDGARAGIDMQDRCSRLVEDAPFSVGGGRNIPMYHNPPGVRPVDHRGGARMNMRANVVAYLYEPTPSGAKSAGWVFDVNGLSPTLLARDSQGPRLILVEKRR